MRIKWSGATSSSLDTSNGVNNEEYFVVKGTRYGVTRKSICGDVLMT